ncbi:MAG: hypothetical protein ACXVXC_15545 [Nocardioidaceae bacterium]
MSALVDGQLDEESAEQAWAHVQHCAPCRQRVEREGWVKRQLASMGGSEPPERLLGSLYRLEPADGAADLAGAWAAVGEIEHQGRTRRRVGIALVGAGSVGAAVFGISALSAAPFSGPTGTPAAQLTRGAATSTPNRATVAPAAAVHGRLPGWTLRNGDDGVARARPVVGSWRGGSK